MATDCLQPQGGAQARVHRQLQQLATLAPLSELEACMARLAELCAADAAALTQVAREEQAAADAAAAAESGAADAAAPASLPAPLGTCHCAACSLPPLKRTAVDVRVAVWHNAAALTAQFGARAKEVVRGVQQVPRARALRWCTVR